MDPENTQEESHNCTHPSNHRSLQQSKKKTKTTTKRKPPVSLRYTQTTAASPLFCFFFLIVLRSVSFCSALLSPAWQSSEITPGVTVDCLSDPGGLPLAVFIAAVKVKEEREKCQRHNVPALERIPTSLVITQVSSRHKPPHTPLFYFQRKCEHTLDL